LDVDGCLTCSSYARRRYENYIRRHLPAYLAKLSERELQRMVRRVERQLPKSVWEEVVRRSGQMRRSGTNAGNASNGSNGKNSNSSCNSSSRRKNDIVLLESCIDALLRNDARTEELLSIQGRIWKAGRRNTMRTSMGTAPNNDNGLSGERLEEERLDGHIYPDVLPLLGMCKTRGLPVCLYADIDVREQRQLMRLSSQGDMGVFVSGYFDTGAAAAAAEASSSSVGPKTDPGSYRTIARRMEVAIEDVVVVGVDERELEAARQAGAQAVLRRRPADWGQGQGQGQQAAAENGDDNDGDGGGGKFPVCCSMMQLFQSGGP